MLNKMKWDIYEQLIYPLTKHLTIPEDTDDEHLYRCQQFFGVDYCKIISMIVIKSFEMPGDLLDENGLQRRQDDLDRILYKGDRLFIRYDQWNKHKVTLQLVCVDKCHSFRLESWQFKSIKAYLKVFKRN